MDPVPEVETEVETTKVEAPEVQTSSVEVPDVEAPKVYVVTRQAILEEAKKQDYELTDELIDTPMKEGMLALLLFPQFDKVIISLPTYVVTFKPGQTLMKVNIPKVSDGVSNISVCFQENIKKADFDIMATAEDGTPVSVWHEELVKEQLLQCGVEYGNWISYAKTHNTILDIMNLTEENPFVITLQVEESEQEQTAEIGFERIYYKREAMP